MSQSEASSSNQTLQQRLELRLPGYNCLEKNDYGRKKVKEDIVHAYDLQRAANTLKQMLIEERVSSNPVLKTLFQEQIEVKERMAQEILQTDLDLLGNFEQHLMELVKYQIQHDERNITKIPSNPKLSRWLGQQRYRVNNFLEGKLQHKREKALQVMQDNMAILKRLHVQWRSAPKKRTYDDYMAELKEFKAKNGHVKVQRLEEGTNLGEWVQKIRKEYDQLNEGKTVPNLTPARITELNKLGMVWKIRHGRPKKGDERFRLRRGNKQNLDTSERAVKEGTGNPTKRTETCDCSL